MKWSDGWPMILKACYLVFFDESFSWPLWGLHVFVSKIDILGYILRALYLETPHREPCMSQINSQCTKASILDRLLWVAVTHYGTGNAIILQADVKGFTMKRLLAVGLSSVSVKKRYTQEY